MSTLLRAFLLFIILLALALLLGQASTGPIPVTLTLGTLSLGTTAPVAITLVIALLLLAFYFGRFTSWVLHLPRRFLNYRKVAAADAIADAYAALALQDLPTTGKLITDVRTENAALSDLLILLHLHTATISPTQAQASLSNPRLAAITALYLARHAAAQSDWNEVRRLTAIGRKYAPHNLPLLTLQFKALVNLNDPAAADLLPALKSHLGSPRHKLLTQVIQGSGVITTRPNVTMLDSPWVKSIQTWLPTPSDTFPAE